MLRVECGAELAYLADALRLEAVDNRDAVAHAFDVALQVQDAGFRAGEVKAGEAGRGDDRDVLDVLEGLESRLHVARRDGAPVEAGVRLLAVAAAGEDERAVVQRRVADVVDDERQRARQRVARRRRREVGAQRVGGRLEAVPHAARRARAGTREADRDRSGLGDLRDR